MKTKRAAKTVTAGIRDLEAICKSAAHLVAAMYDGRHGFNVAAVDPEVRDALEVLRDEMRQVEFLEPYELGDGRLGIV